MASQRNLFPGINRSSEIFLNCVQKSLVCRVYHLCVGFLYVVFKCIADIFYMVEGNQIEGRNHHKLIDS